MKARYVAALTIVAFALLATANPLQASETDRRIESSASNSYVFRTYLKDDDVKVHSRNGVVTLTGTVREESHKSLAGETAGALPGVKKVHNRLSVKEKAPTKSSDAWVIAKVKAALLVHRNVSALQTEVDVKSGVVTLRGEASSDAQKELTTEYVKDIEGVKGVRNEMSVPPKPRGKTDTVMETIDDASITAQVKLALLTHRSTSALDTKVDTDDGVVTLAGKAKNAAEKDLVTKIVSDIKGVKSVKNNMTVGKTG
ncbi:BON domain-containing protein [bacterium]|nr:BON domain-containing protein [bacterium]